jgi:hypothetical protein
VAWFNHHHHRRRNPSFGLKICYLKSQGSELKLYKVTGVKLGELEKVKCVTDKHWVEKLFIGQNVKKKTEVETMQ